jgi:hypothetical protein
MEDEIWGWDAGVSDGEVLVVSSGKMRRGRCGNYTLKSKDSDLGPWVLQDLKKNDTHNKSVSYSTGEYF